MVHLRRRIIISKSSTRMYEIKTILPTQGKTPIQKNFWSCFVNKKHESMKLNFFRSKFSTQMQPNNQASQIFWQNQTHIYHMLGKIRLYSWRAAKMLKQIWDLLAHRWLLVARTETCPDTSSRTFVTMRTNNNVFITRRPLSTGIFCSFFAFITWAIAILGGE